MPNNDKSADTIEGTSEHAAAVLCPECGGSTRVVLPSGGGLGHTRHYGILPVGDYDGPNGWNWFIGELPYAVASGTSASVVCDPNNPFWFDNAGSGYVPRYNLPDLTLVDNGTTLTFTQTGNAQVVTTVFNSLTASVNPGLLVSHTDARGAQTAVTSVTGSRINQLQRSYVIAGITTTEYINYAFYSSSSGSPSAGPSSGGGAGKIKTVTYGKQVGSGPVEPITRAASTYYGPSDANGSYNDLATVTRQIPDGSGGWLNIGVDYFRYCLARRNLWRKAA